MRQHQIGSAILLAWVLASPGTVVGQENRRPAGAPEATTPQGIEAAPRLIRTSGRLSTDGGAPLAGDVIVTFAIYPAQHGGSPLWNETQRVTVDAQGQYSALLGATSPGGLPIDLFSSTEPRWLGVRAGQTAEQPRMLLLSVPYAIKAADAETLGGRPASDYLLAASQPMVQAAASPSDKSLKGGGTPGALAKFTAVDTLADAVVFETGGNVGVGTTTPTARLDVAGDVKTSGRVTGTTGRFSASSGTTETLRSEISATGGYAIIGLASPGPGQTGTGVFGWLIGPSGDAVLGEASAATGNTVGVHGRAQSPSGVGGLFENTAGGDLLRAQTTPGNTRFRVDTSGTVHAVAYRDLSGNPIPNGDITAVTGGTGLTGGGSAGDVSLALDTSYTNTLYAPVVHGHIVGDVAGAATLGANSFTGNQNVTGSLSVIGAADVDGGIAGFGGPTKPNAVGVRGETTSGTAEGVLGVSISVTGRGARGLTTGTAGIGVKGEASAATGTTTGVLGSVASAAGTAGVFENTAGGDLLQGLSAGVPSFRVDGTGAVYAGSYRDLAGNPIPSGTGDITAVTGGTGLTGGGTGGDVSLALDTSYTSTLYAPVVHAHSVGDVAGAATLGANAFSGNQTVSGFINATGGVQGVVSTTNPGVLGQSSASNGLGVRGTATGTGTTTGVLGFANSPTGTGVEGESVSLTGATVGVLGKVVSPDGVAVFGQSLQNNGPTIGVHGSVNSPAGYAAVFDNVAGGTILAGRRNGAEKFRVDGDGFLYAPGYRDLAGNPIPSGTGDITAVTSGTGLTGGGGTGDVSLALDTSYTSTLYAPVVHGHTVGEVAGAATLGSNAFVGSQTVNGPFSVTGGNVGVGTTAPTARLDVVGDVKTSGRVTGTTGRFSASSGTTETLRSEISGTGGYAIIGLASPGPSQTGTGVFGWLIGPAGVAVYGEASAATGNTVGVHGRSQSPSGVGGLFENPAGGDLLRAQTAPGNTRFRVDTSGTVHAVAYRDLAGNPIPNGDITAVTPGTGLTGGGGTGDVSLALDTSYTNTLYAPIVHGHTVGQVAGAATLGANAFTGNQNVTGSLSVIGAADVDGGIAGFGGPTKPNAVGVRGETTSGTAEGVLGVSISTTGRGARGLTTGTAGIGVKGEASAATGATTGVLGSVASPAGTAGVFENTAGGDLLQGLSAGTPSFRVDGTGAVYAASYRDLAGNPIPSGTGDITAVTPGTGLTGGGGTGDLSLALDTSYTSTLYAAVVHGHTVGQVAGAATLGANSFTGAQQINHTLNVSGDGAAQSSLQATNNLTSGISVRGSAFGVGGRGVYGDGFDGVQGVSSATSGRGVFGWSTSAGSGTGVNGQAGGSSGVGVSGQAYSATGVTRGVLGTASSPDGIGVDGVASAASGVGVGVRGRSSAGGAAVQGIATAAGPAGLFDNTSGGDLLVGRTGAGSTPVFRVDGTGRGYFNNGTQVGGADFAESFAVSGDRDQHMPGDVLIIDTELRRTLQRSTAAYATTVAGIHSTKPGVLATPHPVGDPRIDEEVPLAVVGIVPCKVSAENGAIRTGDLLVTSNTPGHAMKGTDPARMLGAIVGKALEPLERGTGVILVLVTLQ